ncbi:MAG: ribonuclease III family protein [Candidatus Kariarchaeaceae archaeon]|jgi:ribonuclease-3
MQHFINTYQLPLTPKQLAEALIHPSIRWEQPLIQSYERLEILGDAVLSLLVTKKLMQLYPTAETGELTDKRKQLVNNPTLSALGGHLDLAALMIVHPSYQVVSSDLADGVEAIFGAIYHYGGIDACEGFLNQILKDWERLAQQHQHINAIGQLQEWMQQQGYEIPSYEVINREGPDNQPTFTMRCSIQLGTRGLQSEGKGNSKQQSREAAARGMLQQLSDLKLGFNRESP